MKRFFVILLVLIVGMSVYAQETTERTVEESYLQDPIEAMIIREQAYSNNRDTKLVAVEYLREAVDAGHTNEDIMNVADFLATEGISTVARSANRVTNNFPDVRREVCDLLGNIQSVESKDILVKVVLGDSEPTVISSAIRSLGKVGIIENDDVTQAISFVVNRYNYIAPDNSLAYEALGAFEALAKANGGIKDASVVRSVIMISDGNYISPVKNRAKQLLADLRKSGSSGK